MVLRYIRMSLKITHTILIILSIMLTGFFSFSMINENNESYSTLFSIAGILSTLALSYYLISILKKFKTL